MDIYTGIDEFIVYARNNLLLDELDENYVRNGLINLLGIESYKSGNPDEDKIDALTSPKTLLDDFIEVCLFAKLTDKASADVLAKRIMETLSLKPSRVNDIYADLGGKGSVKADKFLSEYVSASLFGQSSNPAFVEEVTDEGLIVRAKGEGKPELAPVYLAIDELIYYAENYLLLDSYDVDYTKRAVCNLLGLDSYAPQEPDYDKVDGLDRPDLLVIALKDAIVSAGLVKEENAESVANEVMGLLSVYPSEINDLFNALPAKKATDFLYDYSVKNYYVKKSALERNIRFKSDYTRGGLEITINKSRPEYTTAGDAVKGNTPGGGYPKCTICAENEGFEGTGKTALRTVSIELGGEEWFWQYSPYGYLSRHGIAVSKTHAPMKVTDKTLVQLMDFVDRFPHFFIGCNASLAGVGGSVLSHNHFQGGEETLPIHRAKGAIKLVYPKYPLADVEVLDWYDSVIRVTSQSRQVLAEIEKDIREGWENYTSLD